MTRVKPGDNLFEIETDKTSMEVPATSAGVLAEVLVGEGEVVPVGAVVAVISGDGVASSSSRAPRFAVESYGITTTAHSRESGKPESTSTGSPPSRG